MPSRIKDTFVRSGYDQNGMVYLLRRLFWRLIRPLPDRLFIQLKFFSMTGYWPNLKSPRSFAEKVQYRKLYDRNPLYVHLVDKIAVKGFVANRVGSQYTIPTYWTGTDLDEIDWDTIPLPAVIKPNHASGLGRFLFDKSDIEQLLTDNPIPSWLDTDHASFNREWAYGEVRPQILIEKMLTNSSGIPWDYRCFVFDGEVSHIVVETRIDGKGYCATYSPTWERLPFYDPDYFPPCPHPLPRPPLLDQMLKLASTLGQDLDFVRVDLLATDEELFVGELTLYPGGGFDSLEPPEYDLILGDKWHLNTGQRTEGVRALA